MIIYIESEKDRPSDLHMPVDDATDVLTGSSDQTIVELSTKKVCTTAQAV